MKKNLERSRAEVVTPDVLRERMKSFQPTRSAPRSLRPAAVLVPMFFSADDGELRLWAFRRPNDGSAHGGQISLPGGKVSNEDKDMRDTALREAWEEVGLVASDVEVLGELNEYVTLTGFRICPFVGLIPPDFVPRPNEDEVDHMLVLPLRIFASPGRLYRVSWGSRRVPVPGYRVDGEIVWGATAAILKALARRVFSNG